MVLYAKPMEGQELLFFLSGGGRIKLRVVLQCIFRRDFLCPCTTRVSGIEKYHSACVSCCSDGTVVTVLRYLKSGVQARE